MCSRYKHVKEETGCMWHTDKHGKNQLYEPQLFISMGKKKQIVRATGISRRDKKQIVCAHNYFTCEKRNSSCVSHL